MSDVLNVQQFVSNYQAKQAAYANRGSSNTQNTGTQPSGVASTPAPQSSFNVDHAPTMKTVIGAGIARAKSVIGKTPA